jgi:hypothetical protein
MTAQPLAVRSEFTPAPDAAQRLLALCRILATINRRAEEAGLDSRAQYPHEKI